MLTLKPVEARARTPVLPWGSMAIKARKMENELREFLIYSGQGEFYREMLRERRAIKNQRLRKKRAQELAKKDAMDLALIVFLFGLGGGVLAVIVALIAEAQ